MNFDIAALEHRVAALEASQTASLRFGRVTGVEGGKSRVQFKDGQGMNSFLLSSVQKRVLKDQDIKMPDIGEPVACLFAGNGCEQGVVLGAYYNGNEQDPQKPQSIDYHKYEDGTELWYDREEHKLVAKVQGDCEIECEKTIKASCKEEAEIKSEKKITLEAPQIVLKGSLTMESYSGAGGEGILEIKGNVDVKGDVVANHHWTR